MDVNALLSFTSLLSHQSHFLQQVKDSHPLWKQEAEILMSVSIKRLALAGVAMFGVAGGVRSADEATSRPPSSAAALAAPEFVKILDVDAAVAAFRADDADALLAIGERLSEAEHAVGKPNEPLPAVAFYRMAIQSRRNNHDLKQLDQLETVISGAKHLSQPDRQRLLAEIGIARKFISGPRKIDAGPGLKPSEVSAEAIALYHTFAREIHITQEYGTEEELRQLVDGIKQLRELHPKQRDHLASLALDARVAIRDRDKPDPTAILLASVSRSVTSGLRILGPVEVPQDGVVQLVVLATNPAGKKPGQLHFRSNTGVKVPESLAWSGTPLLVPATIQARAGTPVFVSAGLNSGANALTWNAQVASK